MHNFTRPAIRYLSALGGIAIIAVSTIAQDDVDTTLNIPEVEISAFDMRNTPVGSQSQEWDSQALHRSSADNLAELISSESGTFIKSYGLGSIATSSIRGGSAAHTVVLWNGFPIQNPMLGQVDLALLPLQAAGSVRLTRGGNTALWGSGAIGGVLSLHDKPDFTRPYNFRSKTAAGNFGLFEQQLEANIGSESLQSVTRLSHLGATNDYPYTPAPGLPVQRQANASLSQQNIMQDLYWNPGPGQQLRVHFWRQQTDRQIPPTIVQTESHAQQEDQATRLMAAYQQVTKNGFWQLKTAYFNERLNYDDDQILLASRSRFNTYLGEITAGWNADSRHRVLIGNSHMFTRAWSAGYGDQNPSEYRSAVFVSWKWSAEAIHIQMSLRQAIVDGQFAPIIPEFGFDLFLSSSFTVQGKLSRNYRLPTLNDRYWKPGGNADLLPEAGWSQELSLVHRAQQSHWDLTASLTVFNRTIDDWILWSRPESQNYWSPHNITRVWSRGIEPRVSVSFIPGDLEISFRAGYDYVRSTNQVALESPAMDSGQQLIYTPMHQGFALWSIHRNNFYLTYRHTFTGSTDGINEHIPPWNTGNFRIQYNMTMAKLESALFVNINNIWDRDYQVIERRPMPGRYYRVGVEIKLSK